MRKIKTIRSHSGLIRFMAEVSELAELTPVGYLAHFQVKDIPSPYAYSPAKPIFDWHGVQVVWFETRHRYYEVFEVPADMPRYETDGQATAANTVHLEEKVFMQFGSRPDASPAAL